jgi:hypothetical protein
MSEQDTLGDADDWMFLLTSQSHPKVSDRIAAIKRYMSSTEMGGLQQASKKDL